MNILRRVAFWLSAPVIVCQGLWVRKRAPRFPPAGGPSHGRFGNGTPLRMLTIGDSIAAGVGAAALTEALPGRTAQALAARLGREVFWCAVGRSGARAAHVRDNLLPTVREEAFDVVVVSVGVNDVTGLSTTRRWRSDLAGLLDSLRSQSPNALIVVAGCPPFSIFPLLPKPLRYLLGMRAKSLDVVTEQEVSRRHNVLFVTTSFDPGPGRFSADGYHPSPASYREWGEALADLMAPHVEHQQVIQSEDPPIRGLQRSRS